MLQAVKIRALAHLLRNGRAVDLALFGAFPARAVAGRIAVKRGSSRPASARTLPAAADVGGYGACVLWLHAWLIGVPVVACRAGLKDWPDKRIAWNEYCLRPASWRSRRNQLALTIRICMWPVRAGGAMEGMAMAENEPSIASGSGTLVADRVGDVLDGVANNLDKDRFESIIASITRAGHWSLLVVAVIGFLSQLLAAWLGSGTAILWGLAWLVALPLLQYTAVQFLDATRTLVDNNRSSLGSNAFLRSYALVALIAGITALIAAFAWGIEAGSLRVFGFPLVVAALSLGTVWLALNPELLNIRIDRSSRGGEEALGLLSFFVKAGVRLVPIFYGVTLLVSAVLGVLGLLGMIGDSRIEILAAVNRAEQTVPVILWAVLSPFLAYVSFVVYYLAIDLMRAILAIPNMSGGNRRGGSRAGKKTASKRTASKKKAAASTGSSGGTETTAGDAT